MRKLKGKQEEMDEKKEEKMEYTGGNFLPYTNLIELVDSYQTRTIAEEVSKLEILGGKSTGR